MPTTFFTNFQNVTYRFGDNETPVFTKKLSQYVSVLDQLRNTETLIEKYTVIAGDRPDTISFRTLWYSRLLLDILSYERTYS